MCANQSILRNQVFALYEQALIDRPVTYASNRAQLLFCMTNQDGSCGAPPIADEYFGPKQYRSRNFGIGTVKSKATIASR